MPEFFIFGCEGSGTTWLAEVLDSAPSVQCLMETRIPLVLHDAAQALTALLDDADTHRNTPGNERSIIRESTHLREHLRTTLRLWGNETYAGLRRADVGSLGDTHPYYRLVSPFLRQIWPDAAWGGIWRAAEATIASNRRRFGVPFRQALQMWKEYAHFLLDATPPGLLLQYERVSVEGAPYVRSFVERLTEQACPAGWYPAMPRDSGTPVSAVLSGAECWRIRLDPEVHHLTTRLTALSAACPRPDDHPERCYAAARGVGVSGDRA
jgi:hypothetical protein